MGIAFGKNVNQKEKFLKRLVLFIFVCCIFGTLGAQDPDSQATTLQPIVVRPRPNPAHRIIENAINNRDKNNPEKNRPYRCMQYNKMTLHVQEDSTALRFMARGRMPFVQPDASYGLIVESVTERTFAGPGRIEEKIIASQTSGFKEYQQLSMLPLALQFFHFYEDVIEWKEINQFYLNPISPNSTDKYFFLLLDTLISAQGDSTFAIAFRPGRGSNIDGLKGTLYINSRGWAIERVEAEPATAELLPVKIRQQYRLIDSTTWFPSSLGFEILYKNFGFTGLDMTFYSNSSISDVVIDPPMDGRKMAARTIWMAPDAHKRPEYIEHYRAISLSQKELNTYKRYEQADYDWLMQVAEGAMDRNSFSYKMFDIPFNQVLNYNFYEGLRLGAGLYTNWRFSPYFSVGGYGRYGLKDKEIKYGVSVSVFPRRDWDSELSVWYRNDISGLSFSREAGIGGAGWWGNLHFGLQAKAQSLAPFFEYNYKGQYFDRNHGLCNSQASIQLRYAVREQRSKIFRRTQTFRSDHPVFYLNYAVNMSDAFASPRFYHNTELGMEFNTYFRNVGRTYFSLWGGLAGKDVPVMLLFGQSYLDRTIFLAETSKSSFNVITNQIYASDRYVHAFLYHDFGSLLYKSKSKIFRPRLALAQSVGWSQLTHPDYHGGRPLLDMQQGYWESGIVVEDIIRLNYLNFCYIGLGGGLYGAYGGSVELPFPQTLTPLIRLSASF